MTILHDVLNILVVFFFVRPENGWHKRTANVSDLEARDLVYPLDQLCQVEKEVEIKRKLIFPSEHGGQLNLLVRGQLIKRELPCS